MKIIITMAGEGRRFKEAGHKVPKYEIEVNGKTLFEWSLLSLKNFFDKEFIFVGRSDFNFEKFVENKCKQLNIEKFSCFSIAKLTSGQGETLYEAIKDITVDDSILVHNIDTVIHQRCLYPERINSKYWWVTADLEGAHWSFAKMDKESKLIETSEKKKISSYASVGIYYFHSLLEYKNIYLSNFEDVKKLWKETYIAPFYNFVDRNDFDILHISKEYVCGLGTPDEVENNKSRLSTFFDYEDVSMVVTQYNGWEYLGKIIDLFIKNKRDNIIQKLIIVNNGSTTQIPADCLGMIKNEENIILIQKDYGNIGFGRQVAIDNAIGKYVTIVDVDDEFDVDYVEKLYEKAISKNYDMVNANKVNYDFDNKKILAIEKMSVNGKIKAHAAFPHNRLFKRELLSGLIVDKMTSIDDMSFIPIAIARAKSVTEVNTNYYWRTGVAESASRGLSISRVNIFFKKAMVNLLPYEKERFVKFAVGWHLIFIENHEPGYIKRSPFKLRFFWPSTADMMYVNFMTFLYKIGIIYFTSRISNFFRKNKYTDR